MKSSEIKFFSCKKNTHCYREKTVKNQEKHVVIVNRINRGAWLDIGPDLAEYVSSCIRCAPQIFKMRMRAMLVGDDGHKIS